MAYLVKKHNSYLVPTAGPADSIVTYRYNKYRMMRNVSSLYAVLPLDRTDMVLVGNSLIANFPIEMFQNLKVKDRGITGTNTTELLNRMDKITDAQPSKNF